VVSPTPFNVDFFPTKNTSKISATYSQQPNTNLDKGMKSATTIEVSYSALA